MQVKGKDVIGLNIITIDTGTIIETVDDIAYNPSTQRVEALLVSSGGLFSSAKAIHIDDVHNIGENAVVVKSADAIKSVKDLSDVVHSIADSNKHLVKTNVITSEGKELGKVTDIYFDSVNGNVYSMEVSQGGLKTLSEGKKSIKPADIITIGADATIVSTYTELKLEAQGQEGGIKGKINDAKDKASELATSTKETVQNATDKVVDVSKEAAETVKDKSVELKDGAQEKSEELADVAAEKTDDLKEAARQRKAQTEDTLSNAVNEGKEMVKDVKDTYRTESSSPSIESDKVVEQTTQKYEDATKKVEVEKTKVTKKK